MTTPKKSVRVIAVDNPAEDSLLADRWLNADEAGKYLGYSAWSIRHFATRKLITHTKAPGQSGGYRFRRQWLDEFLESRTIPAKTNAAMLAAREERMRAENALNPDVSGQKDEEIDPELARAIERAKRKIADRAAGEKGAK